MEKVGCSLAITTYRQTQWEREKQLRKWISCFIYIQAIPHRCKTGKMKVCRRHDVRRDEIEEKLVYRPLSCNVFDIQSSPSYRPVPVVAQVAWMYHWRFLSEFNPSFWVISLAGQALGRSLKSRRMKTTLF